MNHTKLKDQLHLEKVILNPIDRSQGRYNAILEYVKKKAKIEHWKSETTGKISKFLTLYLPNQNGINYHSCLDFREGKNDQEKEEKAQIKIAQQIFDDH
jgi:hypothetical protein